MNSPAWTNSSGTKTDGLTQKQIASRRGVPNRLLPEPDRRRAPENILLP